MASTIASCPRKVKIKIILILFLTIHRLCDSQLFIYKWGKRDMGLSSINLIIIIVVVGWHMSICSHAKQKLITSIHWTIRLRYGSSFDFENRKFEYTRYAIRTQPFYVLLITIEAVSSASVISTKCLHLWKRSLEIVQNVFRFYGAYIDLKHIELSFKQPQDLQSIE